MPGKDVQTVKGNPFTLALFFTARSHALFRSEKVFALPSQGCEQARAIKSPLVNSPAKLSPMIGPGARMLAHLLPNFAISQSYLISGVHTPGQVQIISSDYSLPLQGPFIYNGPGFGTLFMANLANAFL